MPVRWLLADEVGLGKTIEAALIMNRLLHTQTIERCLVVAPEALTVQWLGELWRKYHQVFTLLDPARLADVARDFGAGFNPFDAHRRAVIALETLIARPELTGQAVTAGIDLLVVDEAHRLRRPPGHPGEPGYRAVAPIAALGRHVLLLSATPLEDDAHGFFRLLQLLRPEEFPEGMDVEARLASGVPLPPCTSSTRRVDIGGLPPRVPIAIDVPAATRGSTAHAAPIRGDRLAPGAPGERERPRHDAVGRRRALDRIRRALASGAALKAVLGPDEIELRQQAEAMDRADPRLDWLLTQAKRWRRANEKTLVFVAHRETLEMLRDALSARAQLASGVFHEDLSAARRDTEVARFRADDGPSILVSTEAGGEGRNFEFCHRLVLYDLPWKPSTVEQRIGRLDRIGRRMPVEIVVFPSAVRASVPTSCGCSSGSGFSASRWPASSRSSRNRRDARWRRSRSSRTASLSDAQIEKLIADAQAARTRIHEAAYQQLHRDPYRAELGPSILARVPAGLDALMERVVVNAASRLGFRIEQVRGRCAYAIEFGNEALVDSLPGVPGGSSFVGSFDREYAVEDESIDFFCVGPLARRGTSRALRGGPEGACRAAGAGRRRAGGDGLIAIYKDGPQFDVTALDSTGPPGRNGRRRSARRPIGRLEDEGGTCRRT